MHHHHMCFKYQLFTSILRVKWSALHRNFFAIEKMAAQGMEIADVIFLSSTEMADRIVPLKDTAENTVITTSFDTPWHSTKTQTAPHAFPKWASLDTQKSSACPIRAPKKSKLVTRGPFLLFFAVPKIVANKVLNEGPSQQQSPSLPV